MCGLWGGAVLMHLTLDWNQWLALVNYVMNLRFSYKAGNSLATCFTTRFSRRSLLHAVS